MADGKLEPVGDHTKQQQSEDLPNATVIPAAAHNKNGQAAPMQLIQAEVDEGESTVYDRGLYLGLASGRMQGESEDDIVHEAARITAQVRKSKLGYAEALASTRANGQAGTPTELVVAETPVAAEAVPMQEQQALKAPVESAEPGLRDFGNLHIPNVRVTYEGSFGTIRTRYHSAEMSGAFLVLIFDKRCEIVDMYAPPVSNELLKVAVGEGEKQQEYYVQSMGVNLDLDARTINRYIVVLPVVPDDHEMVREHLGEDGPPMEGDLMPDAPPGMPGQSPVGQTTL